MLRYIRPDESLLGASVSGSVDASYLAAWLTQGEPGHPVKTTGDLSLTVTPSSAQMVDLVALCHHNVKEAATVTLGGSLSSSIPTQAAPPDGIPTNWYRLLDTAQSVSTLDLDISGNSGPIVVGVLYAGLSRTLPALTLGRKRTRAGLPSWESEALSLAPYDSGVQRPERWSGSFTLTESQMDELDDWYLSQRNGNLPTLIIPDYPVGVAWLCTFDYDADDLAPGDAPAGSPITGPEALFAVSLDISVLPRVRW